MQAFFKWLSSLFVVTPKAAVKKQEVKIFLDEPNRQGDGESYYPKAVKHKKKMKQRGTYKGGYPKGAVVHFTAGRYEGGVEKAKDTIEGGIENGYTFLCIGNDGSVVQAHPVQYWGYHAGKSGWKGLTDTVSDELIGIEINNAGKVEKTKDGRYKTWFGTYLTADQVRYVTEKEYGCPTGYYHRFTQAQEIALIELLVWLKKNDDKGQFMIEYILAHHEVSGLRGLGYFRKNDCGGSLSMTMNELRALVLRKTYE